MEENSQDVLTPIDSGGSMELIVLIHVLDRLRELAYMLLFRDDSGDSSTQRDQRGIKIYRQLNG